MTSGKTTHNDIDKAYMSSKFDSYGNNDMKHILHDMLDRIEELERR